MTIDECAFYCLPIIVNQFGQLGPGVFSGDLKQIDGENYVRTCPNYQDFLKVYVARKHELHENKFGEKCLGMYPQITTRAALTPDGYIKWSFDMFRPEELFENKNI